MIAFNVSDSSVVVNVNGQTVVMQRDSVHCPALLQAIKAGDEAAVLAALTLEGAIHSYSRGDITVDGDVVSHKGVQLPDSMARRVLANMRDDVPYEYLLRFFERLNANTSRRSIEQLYTFLDRENLPITPNGTFLAYKGVRSDYFSCTAGDSKQVLVGNTTDDGRIFNGIGEIIKVKRNYVNDDPEQGCSSGLHVGSLEYAAGFKPADGHLLIVEVDPACVVCVPYDCAFQKVRADGYKVHGEYSGPLPSTAVGSDYQSRPEGDTDDWFGDADDDDAAEVYTEDDLAEAEEDGARLARAQERARSEGLANTMAGVANQLSEAARVMAESVDSFRNS